MSAKEVKDLKQENVHKNVRIVKEQHQFGCRRHGLEYLTDDLSTGDRICTRCALVVEERMVCDEAEWRNFDGDTQAEKWAKSRVGDSENPFLSDDFNLGTTLKMIDKNQNRVSSYGGSIVNQYKRRSIDNALKHAFKELDMMGDRISLPSSVLSRAKALYSQLYRHIKLKGNILFIDSKTAACLYMACRIEGCPRTTQEIAAIFECGTSILKNAIKRARSVLKLDMPKERSADMIDRYSGFLELSRDERKKARRIADEIQRQRPNTTLKIDIIAGTSIYLAAVTTRGLFCLIYCIFFLKSEFILIY